MARARPRSATLRGLDPRPQAAPHSRQRHQPWHFHHPAIGEDWRPSRAPRGPLLRRAIDFWQMDRNAEITDVELSTISTSSILQAPATIVFETNSHYVMRIGAVRPAAALSSTASTVIVHEREDRRRTSMSVVEGPTDAHRSTAPPLDPQQNLVTQGTVFGKPNSSQSPLGWPVLRVGGPQAARLILGVKCSPRPGKWFKLFQTFSELLGDFLCVQLGSRRM
jgi:hypothetical protein